MKQKRMKTWAFLGSLAVLLIGLVAFAKYAVYFVYLSSPSMEPTFPDGATLGVRGVGPQAVPGDVIVFQMPEGEGLVVKRVIALGGQTVEIDYAANAVYVDGKALDEPYVKEPMREYPWEEWTGKVPDGCIYVLGDNRNHSADSRSFGPVPYEDVHGVVFGCFNFDQ